MGVQTCNSRQLLLSSFLLPASSVVPRTLVLPRRNLPYLQLSIYCQRPRAVITFRIPLWRSESARWSDGQCVGNQGQSG